MRVRGFGDATASKEIRQDRTRQRPGGHPHHATEEQAEFATAAARGDLSRKITVNLKGEILVLQNTINTIVDREQRFSGY